MKNQFPRDFYIPKNETLTTQEAAGVTFHSYERSGKLYALCFIGKAQKPAWHYSFRSEESRAKTIESQKASCAASIRSKEERKATRAAFVHTLMVGDILGTCWGYEQTNREFFEVVQVRGKSVVIRELAQQRKETQWLAGQCGPVPGEYIGEPITKLVLQGNQVRFESYRHASLVSTRIAGVPIVESRYYSEYA